MDLNEIFIFAKVVEAGSFTAAARGLGMPKSTVSRKVSELEARLGVRLLQRTTRTLGLTDVGRTYFQHSQRIAREVEQAEEAARSLQQTPRGRLRLTVPLNFDFLGDPLASFLRQHREVELEVVCTDRVVHLVEEGFDLAIRAGTLGDSSLLARPLARLRSFVVASPRYLQGRRLPRAPTDLTKHECMVFGGGPGWMRWRLERNLERVEVPVAPRLVVNDFDLLHQAALAGLGVALLPAHRCSRELRTRRLERLLPTWCSSETPIHAVYPGTRQMSAAMKALLDHLQASMTPPPWERARS